MEGWVEQVREQPNQTDIKNEKAAAKTWTEVECGCETLVM